MLAAVREGFAPHHACELCSTNLKTIKSVFGCKMFHEDARTESYRRLQAEYEATHGVPTVRIFTPECKGNAALNKYMDEAKNKSPVTGDTRLWDSLLYLEATLDSQPAFIVMEQLVNFQDTEPYKRMMGTAEAAGYAASCFSVDPRAFGLPTKRKRMFLILQRDKMPCSAGDYFSALYSAGMQRHKDLSLNTWYPSRELFWLPRSHDRYTDATQLVKGNALFPSLSTKTADRRRPSWEVYIASTSHPFRRRKADEPSDASSFAAAKAMSTPDLKQLNGFPRDWPTAETGRYCRCCQPCRKSADWDVTKESAQIGNALPVTSMQAILAAIRYAILRQLLGKAGSLSPQQASAEWRPVVPLRGVPSRDGADRHNQGRDREDVWSEDQHWASQPCEQGLCECCTTSGCQHCAHHAACQTAAVRTLVRRLDANRSLAVIAHNKLEVKTLMAPVVSIHLVAGSTASIPSLETDYTCQASVQTTLKETSAFIAEQTTRDTSGEAVSVSLSQVECRAYLEQRGDAKASKTYTRGDVSIDSDNLSIAQRSRLDAIIADRWDDLFVKNSEDLPQPFLARNAETGNLEPVYVEYAFKPNAKAVRVPCPRFPVGSAKTQVLEEILIAGLKSGLFVEVSESTGALRPMLVGKYDADADRAGVPTAIRMCGDFPPLNDQVEKVCAMAPHIEDEVSKMRGYKYYFSLDASGQYHSFLLAKRSQEASTIWFPRAGRQVKAQYTRMTMGAKNSGATAQTAFNKMFADDLRPEYANRVANAADDICGGADTIDELLDILEEVFRVLCLHHVQLKPSKLHVGQNFVDFWGKRYSGKGVSMSPRNISPALRMRPATNLHELRSLLGYLNQWGAWLGPPVTLSDPAEKRREALDGYRIKVQPMMSLLSTKEDTRPIHERWTKECTAILEEFKLRLIAGAHLQNPIRDGRGFTLITDSSEFGWGAMLCQYDDEHNLILIDHWSAPHKGYGVHAPAFYNEARAVLEGMERSAHYLATCPRELVVLTDSLSLAFIAQTKGKSGISPWRWIRVQEMAHVVRYLPGPRNPADHISRPPFLGPHQFATAGLRQLVGHLLDCLPDELKMCAKPWLAMEKRNDTERIARQLQQWRDGKNPIRVHSATESRVEKGDFDLAIVSPGVYHAPAILKQLAKSTVPWAMLAPTSLLQYLPEHRDRSVDTKALAVIDSAKKIIHLGCDMTWLVYNTTMKNDIVCCLSKDLALRDRLSRGDMAQYDPSESRPALAAPAASAASAHVPAPPAPCGPWAVKRMGGELEHLVSLQRVDGRDDVNTCCAEQLALSHFLVRSGGQRFAEPRLWQQYAARCMPADVDGAGQDVVPQNDVGAEADTSAVTFMCATPAQWKEKQQEITAISEYKPFLKDIVVADDGLRYYNEPRTRKLLLVVPTPYRRYITKRVHELLYHLTEKYTKLRLKDTYWWPFLSRMIRAVVGTCAHCDLIRGHQWAAHAMYRARPASRPGAVVAMDFKGMAASSARTGKAKELLVFLDLGNSRLRLAPQLSRDATTTLRSFIDHVETEWGVPIVIHSDQAAEFTGRVVSAYCRDMNIRQINTRGYNPRGNAAVERVMRYLNACFSGLTDAQYRDWPWYLSTIRAAWDDHVVDGMGTSPYQATHGLPRRTPADALAPVTDASDPGHMTATDVATLAACQEACLKIAQHVRQFTRAARADSLNARGNKRTFKVADRVKFYCGVSAAEATKRGRKAKHCSHYRPGVIIEAYPEHPSLFKIKCDSTKRTFMRCVINIAHRRVVGAVADTPFVDDAVEPHQSLGHASIAPATEPAVPLPASESPMTDACKATTVGFNVGEFVAAIDAPADGRYWLAKVTSVTASSVFLWAYGTTAQKVTATTRFLPLYTYYDTTNKKRTSHITTYPLNHPGCQPWTYELSIGQLPGLVLARALRLLPTGAPTTKTIAALGNLNTYVHHMIRKEHT